MPYNSSIQSNQRRKLQQLAQFLDPEFKRLLAAEVRQARNLSDAQLYQLTQAFNEMLAEARALLARLRAGTDTTAK
jgi:hypothetical protein